MIIMFCIGFTLVIVQVLMWYSFAENVERQVLKRHIRNIRQGNIHHDDRLDWKGIE